MRLNLEGLDASGLDLAFGPDPAHERRILLGMTKGLRGSLSRTPDSLRLSDVMAESLVVSLLHLKFETFAIALRAEGALSDLSGSYEAQSDGTELHLVARSLHAPELSVAFDEFQICGELRAENVELHISGSRRRVQADSLEIDGLSFAGSVALRAERLTAKNVDVSWGAGGYGVQVGEVQLTNASAAIDISGSLGASSEKALGEKEAPGHAASSSEGKTSLVDWDVLDGLSGSLDVDVLIDMKIPVIGSRRATHPFRIAVQSGAVNYLDLEGDLSTLEDAFLDFAVREGALVLERGIPFLPTRGRGKPIVAWPLSTDDALLARQNRVRLAVLPRGRLAVAQEPSKSESNGSGFTLRQLSFVDVQALLRLEPIHPATTPFRELSFEELVAYGTVHHQTSGEPPSGELTGKLRGLGGSVVQLPLGTSRLDVGTFRLGQLSNLQLSFRGVSPQKIGFDLADLRATSLSLGS